MDSVYRLEMKGITKRFPGVLALDEVDLELRKGEVLALIGENGAGKSTLMKILSGAYRPDTGRIMLDGKDINPDMTPKERMDIGISIIYQELNYLDEMTIAENLFMERIPLTGVLRRVNYKKLREDTEALLKTFNIKYHPFTEVNKLTVAEKQMLEILRAISRDVRVLIMDEPTSSLNEVETRRLFELIRDLKGQGVSIIYISHKLNEVFEIADRVQVMRDGKRVGLLDIDRTDTKELVGLMVGRDIKDMYPKGETQVGDVVLRVEGLSCDIARDISFEVRQGEIVGLFGLEGSGRVETVEGILGSKVPGQWPDIFRGQGGDHRQPHPSQGLRHCVCTQ
jgi:ABC-type sugar transport system ATPase subunit